MKNLVDELITNTITAKIEAIYKGVENFENLMNREKATIVERSLMEQLDTVERCQYATNNNLIVSFNKKSMIFSYVDGKVRLLKTFSR